MDATQTAVRAVRDVGPDAVAIDLESPPEFDAQPGQFVKLTFDLAGKLEFEAIERLAAEGELDVETADELDRDDEVLVSRFYTISSPTVGDVFEITVGIDPEGTVAPVLADLAAGDVVTMSGPFGNDYYEGEDPAVVLAGGPGVGPAVGIAERAIADGNQAAVVYQDEAPIHEERLADLRSDGATVAIVDTDEGFAAAVDEVVAEYGADSQIFVYGFAEFIDEATDAIETAGGDAQGAKMENFG
jgi:3-phenylpropionate/trans-cinnamate dioxygenase ferredoxin reductase subunit